MFVALHGVRCGFYHVNNVLMFIIVVTVLRFLTFLPHCVKCIRGLAMRILFVSVPPSVYLSVKLVDCDKTEEKSVQNFIPNERTFSLVFKKNG